MFGPPSAKDEAEHLLFGVDDGRCLVQRGCPGMPPSCEGKKIFSALLNYWTGTPLLRVALFFFVTRKFSSSNPFQFPFVIHVITSAGPLPAPFFLNRCTPDSYTVFFPLVFLFVQQSSWLFFPSRKLFSFSLGEWRPAASMLPLTSGSNS